jgi:putative transposase
MRELDEHLGFSKLIEQHLTDSRGTNTQLPLAWKKQYAGLGISELRELRQLRGENGRPKRLVADFSLDRQILREVVSKRL